jgi:hypothetical protein
MNDREQRHVVEESGRSFAQWLLAAVSSGARLVSLAMVAVAVAAGCGTDDSSRGHLEDFRCRIANDDGTCASLPANCPVFLPKPLKPEEPHCPGGAELIPIAADDCAQKLICTD